MEVFDEIDWFKTFQTDIFVYCLKLDGLLVLVELSIPLLFVFWIGFGVRAPVCHTQPRVGESGVASDDYHAEDTSSGHEQPATNEFFSAGLDELLGVLVFGETLLEEGGSVWFEKGSCCFSDKHFYILIFINSGYLIKIVVEIYHISNLIYYKHPNIISSLLLFCFIFNLSYLYYHEPLYFVVFRSNYTNLFCCIYIKSINESNIESLPKTKFSQN